MCRVTDMHLMKLIKQFSREKNRKMKAIKILFLLMTILVLTNACKVGEEEQVDSIYMYLDMLLMTTNESKALNIITEPADFDKAELVWKSTNGDVAAVNELGVVTALNPGVVKITVQSKDGSLSDSCMVSVVKIVNYSTTDGLLSNDASAIGTDSLGNMWFGTWLGLSKFDGVHWTSYSVADGFIKGYVRCIAFDANGNGWFGTTAGLTKFDGTNWITYTTKDGLLNNEVWSIAFDKKGNKWFGVSGGLSKFDGVHWTSYTLNNGLLGDYSTIFNMVVDAKNDALWTQSYNAVSKFDGSAWSGYSRVPELGLYTTFYGLSIDRHDHIWLPTMDGVFKLVDGNWTQLLTNPNYWIDYVHEICFDNQDSFWFTPRSGLCKSDGTHIAYFSGASSKLINNAEIINMYIDKNENVWIAKSDVGILKLETGLSLKP
jgi:ligand-binding sensor domain-containing protein